MNAFKLDQNGWLVQGAKQLPSPNHNTRPSGVVPELLVLHFISLPPLQYGGEAVRAFFTNQLDPSAHPYFASIAHLRVSSHVFIERTGAVTQFVSFDDRAWHAGQSLFEGRENCNDFSIGIELEGSEHDVFTEAQYQVLSALVAALRAHYPSLGAVAGHEHIAPGRKEDPGPFFAWSRFCADTGFNLPEKTMMKTIQLYHNPRCSKSRTALQQLQDKGYIVHTIDYLNEPPTVEALAHIARLLGLESVRDMMRVKEAEYAELRLDQVTDEAALLAALHAHPRLLERPIALYNEKAAIGRPFEKIEAIL